MLLMASDRFIWQAHAQSAVQSNLYPNLQEKKHTNQVGLLQEMHAAVRLSCGTCGFSHRWKARCRSLHRPALNEGRVMADDLF